MYIQWYILYIVGGADMQTVIKKWGNSQGIRIPKAFLETLGMMENDTVELSRVDNNIVVTKVEKKKYNKLSERLEAFYGKPIDEIFVESETEIDTGNPVGGEIW
jgi:antitoxin MazE